jgi:hypothetical protein
MEVEYYELLRAFDKSREYDEFEKFVRLRGTKSGDCADSGIIIVTYIVKPSEERVKSPLR